MKIGFIGGGNIAQAMIPALLDRFKILAYAKSKNDELMNKFNIQIAKDELELAKNADIIILAIKPNLYESVLKKIKNIIDKQILISVAPTISLKNMQEILSQNAKIVRCMPNTPATIQKAASAVCFNQNLAQNEKNIVMEIFKSFGKAYEIKEEQIPAFVGIAGSLPAYVFMFIEALADAGVKNGLQRELAYDIAASAVSGSAQMITKTKKHPAVLKDEVCSPSGTTIEALNVLENMGFRSAVIEAVNAVVKKCKA